MARAVSQSRESSIVTTITRHLNRLPGTWVCKMPGTHKQQTGLPDLLILRFGRAAFFEVKQPRKQPTKLQAERLEALINTCGVVAGVVHSWEDARELLIQGGMMTREEDH